MTPNPENEDPEEFLRRIFGLSGSAHPADLSRFLTELNQALGQMPSSTTASAGDINWQATQHAALQIVTAKGKDPEVDYLTQRSISEAARLAELWLDDATTMAQSNRPARGLSRKQWVEQSSKAWLQISKPVVTSLAEAMSKLAMPADVDNSQIEQLSKMMVPLMRNAAGSMYSMQVAKAIGELASKTVSGAELGMQLLDQPGVVLIPTNIKQATADFGIDPEDVLIYLTVREAARQRLYNSVGWLAPQLLAMVEHYAREIQIDSSMLDELANPLDIQALDFDKLNEMAENLQGKLFKPVHSAEQNEVLKRLETTLSLIEGWTDLVTTKAVTPWMQERTQLLDELVRRRRATFTNDAFSTLFGFELSPRRVRDAYNLWAAIDQSRSQEARDQLWHHPDLMPSAKDLDDPLGFLDADSKPVAPDDMDQALQRLLDEEENK